MFSVNFSAACEGVIGKVGAKARRSVKKYGPGTTLLVPQTIKGRVGRENQKSQIKGLFFQDVSPCN